jgi:hypothetical protein
MSATVTWVEKKGDKAGILVMSDDTRVWTPDKALGDTLVGKAIPEDWTQKQGEYGPQALPPKPKGGFGGPAAYRNTKEGQLAEQLRMDARTAVMQATVEGVFIKDTADEIYKWLCQASGADLASVSPAAGGVVATHPAPPASPSVIAPAIDGEVEAAGELGEGLPAAVDPRSCKHEATSPLAPSGRALKEGRVRCLDCNLVIEEAKV